MPRKSPSKAIVVMTPHCPRRVTAHYGADDDVEEASQEPKLPEMTPHSRAMVEDARSTRSSLHHQYGRGKGVTVSKNVYYLGSSDENHDIRTVANSLAVEGSMLVISAHGNPFVIGAGGVEGISPEVLAELFSYVFSKKELQQLKCVRFATCNAGYYNRERGMSDEAQRDAALRSYVGRFFTSMHCDHLARDLRVEGPYGFYQEGVRGKHTFVSSKYVPPGAKKKSAGRTVRLAQSLLVINADGSIDLPTEKLEVCGVGMDDTSDELWTMLRKRYSSVPKVSPELVAKTSSRDGVVARVSEAGVAGFFCGTGHAGAGTARARDESDQSAESDQPAESAAFSPSAGN